MKVWWLNKDKNFGDLLTPCIFDFFNIKYEYVSDSKIAECLCVGSIAHRSTPNKLMLGSGIITRDAKINSQSTWAFARGPLTRNRILELGGTCPEIFGDPALLLPYFCAESKKEFDVGIVPHFVDYDLVKEKYKDYKVINVKNNNPLEVAKEITKCRSIISSSLHGIIAAHAYNIPAAWVKFSNKIYGDDVKFFDHYQSLEIDGQLSSVENPKFTSGVINLSPIINIFQSLK